MIKCRLRILLAEHEMTQKELAEKTGIQPMTINKLYNNKISRIPVEAIEKICSTLNCDISDLLKLEKSQ